MSDDLFNIIYNKSLDLLSRREHSFKEIKEKLSARFENKEIIESVIEKLSVFAGENPVKTRTVQEVVLPQQIEDWMPNFEDS